MKDSVQESIGDGIISSRDLFKIIMRVWYRQRDIEKQKPDFKPRQYAMSLGLSETEYNVIMLQSEKHSEDQSRALCLGQTIKIPITFRSKKYERRKR